jgi:hypothetical protein
MGSLSNLYISQSYQSLLHFGNNTSASATLVEIQDGVGTGLGVYLNTTGSISASNTITTNNLIVNNSTELTGVFDLDTYFTASTIGYTNSTQPFFTDTVFVTGSYPLGGYPPSIADVEVGWIGNGINVTNGIVTAVSQSVSGYYITMAGQFPQISQSYRFTGRISPTAKITGSLEVSENLIVSGTFDIEGKVVVNDNVRINGNLEVSGSQRNTGSLFVSNAISSSTITGIGNVTAFSQSLYAEFTNLEIYTSSLRAAFTASGVNTIFTNDITASNVEVRNNLNVVGTLTANKIVTLIESASVIYSSGSNILGDEITDTQTLIGSVIVSGSGALTGSMGITGNLSVGGNISSSTISGIGNVTTYSQSVDARLDFLEGPFSTSVDSRLDSLENFTASTFNTFSQSVDARLDVVEATASLYIPFSQSVDFRLDELENWSSSLQTNFATTTELTQTASFLQNQINQRLFTSSFNSYTSSTNSRLNNLESTTASLNISIANLNSFSASLLGLNTSSLATTGSNTFVGRQTYSSSIVGGVVELSVVANTATMDCSLGNFFTLSLTTSSVNLVPTNIQRGQTITLRITQNATSPGSVTYPTSIKLPSSAPYVATAITSAVDILTFVSYDTSSLFAVATNRLV